MSTTKVIVPGEVYAQDGVRLTDQSTGPVIIGGSGAPAVSAPAGSQYLRTDVPSIYQNTSASSPGTTWTQLGSAAFSGVSAYRSSANVEIGSGSWATFAFNVDTYDTGGYRNGVDLSRFYAPETGYYHMTVGFQFVNNNSGGNRGVGIAKNQDGSPTPTDASLLRIAFSPAGAFDVFLTTSVTARLNAGDYVEPYVYQGSGGSLYVNAPIFSPFTMFKVG